MDLFYNQMFNPQYVNPDYYAMLQAQAAKQYQQNQSNEVQKAVKQHMTYARQSTNWMQSISSKHSMPV